MLERMPRSIFDCYDSMLSNVPMAYTLEARNAFQWLAFAERYLFLEEVAEAAVYNPEDNDRIHSDRRLLCSYEIDDICPGLINPTTDFGTERTQVGFVHPTVKEFFLSNVTKSPEATNYPISEMDSQKMICRASLNYLVSSKQIDSGPGHGPVTWPLLPYARSYWFELVKAVQSKGAMPELTVKLAIALFDTKRKESILEGIDTSLASEREGPEAVHQEMS